MVALLSESHRPSATPEAEQAEERLGDGRQSRAFLSSGNKELIIKESAGLVGKRIIEGAQSCHSPRWLLTDKGRQFDNTLHPHRDTLRHRARCGV